MKNYKGEGWETGCRLADNQVGSIVGRILKNQISLKEGVAEYIELPHKFEDADFCKETRQKFVYHIITNSRYTAEQVYAEYETAEERRYA